MCSIGRAETAEPYNAERHKEPFIFYLTSHKSVTNPGIPFGNRYDRKHSIDGVNEIMDWLARGTFRPQ